MSQRRTTLASSVIDTTQEIYDNKDRKTERERETDRTTERQKDRNTERQKDGKTKRQKDRKTELYLLTF